MNCNFKKKPITLALGYGFISLVAGSAFSAGIEEVTVTAQKREENLQTTPIAITALSGEELANYGITGFDGVAKNSPSISFTPYPSSTNLLILYMRGQGVSDAMQITGDSSIGMYSDGFYISRPQAQTADIADVERIEVLRGPQGTLYGRNTTAGAVNIISQKPTGEFGFKQDFSVGSRNLFRSLTTVNLPKWNDISTKFTVLNSRQDGAVKNAGSSHDFGEMSQQAGRLSLRWAGSDNFIADLFYETGNFDSTPSYYRNNSLNGGSVCVPVNSANCYGGAMPALPFYNYGNEGKGVGRTYRPFDLKQSTSTSQMTGLTLSWDIDDTLTVKSLTGYRTTDWHAYQNYAESYSTANPAAPGGIFPVSYTSDDAVNGHQFSQELQFIGSALDKRIQYVTGLYYFTEGAGHGETVAINLPYYAQFAGAASIYGLPTATRKDRFATTQAKSQAAYAQVTWTPPLLDDRLDITVGVRETKDDRSATRIFLIDTDVFGVVGNENAKASQSFSRFNPALTIDYKWSDALSAYAKLATGYKAGGFSESGPIGNFAQGFKPENVKTYEVGMKSMWFDNRMRANVALFDSRIEDLQLGFTVDPADASVVQAYNAGTATIRGAELDLLLQPIDDLALSFNYSYLDANIDSIKAIAGTTFDPASNPASPYQVGQSIKDVFVMPYAPKTKINAAADYTFLHFNTGSLTAHLDYQFQSSIYDTATAGPAVPGRQNYELPSYGLLNGRLIVALDLPRGDKLKLSLWGKNIAHREYKTHVIGNGNGIATFDPNSLNPNGVTPAGYTSQAAIWSDPSSFGIDLSYQY